MDQPITPQMLMIVSSWLAEVAFEFSMQQETLFLAVGLLGRFLDSSTVRVPAPRQQLQQHAAPSRQAQLRGHGGVGQQLHFCFQQAAALFARTLHACQQRCSRASLVPCLQGVPRGVLQLVAVACMMLAAKQDEVCWGWQSAWSDSLTPSCAHYLPATKRAHIRQLDLAVLHAGHSPDGPGAD